ncbi:amino acid adenylation domain-containing protein [Streptomyces sp. NPDC088766]|uniref:amino acid adenylation domain-containing protein n=1 Tax=Streptomyces sp. NPDC088766 TaxID=3365893 RepID=UPI00382B65AE
MKPRVGTSPTDVAEGASAPTGIALEIHRRALRTPHAEAVADGDVSIDYGALNAAAATVAQELAHRGITAGQAVAVALPRSWRLVCVMLGVLRLGAQVVPLDTQSPAERRHFILRDSAAVALVHETVESVTGLPQDVKAFAADALLPERPAPAAAVEAPSAPGEVSFLFYTSGTTGRPKGVEVGDAGVRRLARPGYISVAPGLRFGCLANPAFDALSFEVWVPLLTGGCCVILGDGDVQSPERLAAALRRGRVNTVFITTSLFNAIVTAVPDCFAAVGEVLVGGEQLNPQVIRRWYRDNAGSGTRLFNAYGPTESTTFALCHPIPRDFDGDVVPIGRPLPQSGAVLVVPDQERVAAPGEVGELLLSGTGLAVGYRHLPEETERRFVRLPWLDGGEERYYRTGDLVRTGDEGLLEYVGRIDRQVKVRGFRIEPGEVELRVLAHPAVRRAHVCTRRAGQEGPNELLAFVVLGQELSYEEFDSHLATQLPAYMRPHQIHLVAELPLNANGKVDQAALLRQAGRPWRPAAASGGPAMTETERRVVELAEEILGTTGLGPGDRWIASGGDSLKALRFCFAVRQRWGRELTQAAVLHDDLAAVARCLTTVAPGGEGALPAPVVSGARSAPATSEQQRLWLVQRRAPGSRAYSVNQAFRVDGPVDTPALRHALRSLVARHEALRTGFGPGPDGLEQTVGEPYDPWHEPNPRQAWSEEEAHAFADTFFAEPFDLAVPRLLRACWLPRDGGGTLLLHLHHIAVDGWSLSILLQDLSAAYAGSGRPGEPAPTPLDFAVWQSDRFASAAYQVQRDELLRYYQGLEEPQEPLPARDAAAAPRARLLHTSLDAVRRSRVDRVCAESGLTRFQVLLSVFSWCLYGVAGLVRPRIAAPVAGRPVHEFENSAGMMANTVLLPLTVVPGEDLRSHLARTRTVTGEVLGRQDVALTDVLTGWEAVGDNTPFDFLFVLENTDFGALRLPGCAQRPLWWAAPEAKCPMTVSVVEHADGCDVLWEYAADRFTGEDVEAMAELFRRGVDALAAGGRSTARDLVVPYRRSLPGHGRGPAPEPGFTTIAEGFGRQVARAPGAPAVVTADGGILSYAALDARAAALARELADRYPIPADGSPCRAALYLDPSAEHVVALLALARLNVTAVPLDPSYPADVLRRVLEEIDPLCVLTTRDGSPTLDTLLPDGVVRHLLTPVDPAPRTDGTSGSYDGHSGDRRTVDAPAHDGARPLYALFTSGSTGVPKGVQIHDRTLCDLIRWQSGPGGLAAPAATQQFSMLAFDVSFQEIFGTLCTGGRLQLVRPEWRQDAPALLDRLESTGAERIFMPYVALQLLAEYAVRLNRYPSRLREVVTAGEQLVCTESIRRWFAGLPGARLFNHYGPTETHVVSALCLEGDPGQWPERPAIGRPVAGADLRVVDAQGDPVPTGCTGELLIGGTMTTRCYLGEPAPDDARFVELPGAGLFYRSGDRAFFDRAGLLHYAGRDDQQIKLSGHRLELGSVEAALLRHPAVVNAVVTREGDRLTAGLEIRGEAPSADDLSAQLSALLPSYVRVDRFRRLEKLPRTPSGKLDRQAVVRAPGEEIRRSAIARTGLSAEEERLTTAFEEVTGSPIAPDRTFFEAGASSLALMRFHLHCTTALGLRFSIADLFEHVTVRSLARHLTAPRPLSPPAAKNEGAPEPGEPIAVVGMAVRVPGAPDLAAFWELVVSGGTGIRRIDAPEGIVGAHSTLDGMLDFDPGHFGISPQEARLMDPQQRHLLMAGVQALAHAGVADTSATRVGLVAGAGENTYFQSLLREADPGRLPDGFQLALHHEKDFLATKVAYHLGLTGPAFSAQTACSSSLVAVHLAAGLLRQGEADVMLAGGVLVDPGLTKGYRYRPQHIFSADGDCRPFSADATGTVGASGVGVVVLKTLRRARRDGDTVYALITGSAINNDGAAKMSYTAPSLAGQREVIRTALARAGRTGADLGYVEAHGTGTRLGDPVEVGALRQAFDVSESGRCALSSVKSQLGHMGAAAGVVGLVRAVLAVHHGTLPPNLNFRAFNPEIGPDPTPFHVPSEAMPWPGGRERVAAVSSFGIGGTNAHVIVEQDTASGPVAAREVPACLVLSASSADALAADAARIAEYLHLHPEQHELVLRHLQAGRVARRLRAAAPVTDAAAAEDWLRAVATGAVPHGIADPDAVTVCAAGRTAHDLAEDWAAGRTVDWGAGSAPAPWDFPPPAFSLSEYDFDRLPGEPRGAPAAAPRRLPRENWLHQPHWVRLRRAHVADTTVPAGRASAVVVVTSESTPRTALAPFEAVAPRVIRVHPAGTFARREPDAYDVDPADPASLRRLLDALSEDGAPVSGDTEWVHALPLGVTGPVGPVTLEQARHTCLDSTAALARALGGRTGSPRVWWLSYGARPVAGPVDRPELALLAGPVEVAPQESALSGHWLDLPDGDLTRWAGHVASVVAGTREAGHPGGPALPRQLALRQGHWWRQGTTPVPEPEGERSLVPAGADTVHLVLGGTGGIGRAIAAWLLEHTRSRVLLLSRNPRLPEELNGWADRIGLVPADVTAMSVHEVAAAVAGHTSRLDGVIHAAGLGHGGLLVRRDATAMRDAAAVRERGALVVEHLIGAFRPEIAVYCSSMSALLGGVGQSDYAAGASLLDGFAHHRATETETTVRIGIDWDIWSETGMATRVLNTDSRHQAHLAVGLTVEEGKAVFAHALALGLPQLLVSTTGIEDSRAFYAPAGKTDQSSLSGPVHPADGEREASGAGGTGERADAMARVVRDLLGVDELDPEASLYDLGADSLTLISLIVRVEEDHGVGLDLASFSHRVSLTEILKHIEAALTCAEPATETTTEATTEATASTSRVVLDIWQEGTGSAVLCLVHPVGGDIQAYRSLVAALGPAPTVCLIADPALRDPETPAWSLAERAHHYDAELRARFGGPDRRLHLAGWSYGARVAMEMAGLAESGGRPLEALYLLDPPPPRAEALVAAYDEAHLERVFAAELGTGASSSPSEHAQAYAERLARCCRANLRSLAEHRVRPLVCVPTYLWLAEHPTAGMPAPADPREPDQEWNTCLPPSAELRYLPTDHYGIVAAPHVDTVAETIRAALASPDAGARGTADR